MSDQDDDTAKAAVPQGKAQQQAERKARADRVAAALRENLRKRKEQARGRAVADKPGEDA
jgi:hypothetical protein